MGVGDVSPMPAGAEVHSVQVEDQRVRVHFDIAIAADHVGIRYRVASLVASPLWLFDVLWHQTPEGDVVHEVERAYVSFEEPETLVIARTDPRLPRLKSVERSYPALARRLDGHGTLEGAIRLALPAEEYNLYYPPTSDRAVYRPETARVLKLALEHAEFPDSVSMGVIKPGKLWKPWGTGGAYHRIERSVALDAPIPVRCRSDMFEPV